MDRIIHTRYCGSLQMEVELIGPLESKPDTHAYSIKAKLGKAPLWVNGLAEVHLEDQNPQGNDALTLACNQFVDQLRVQNDGKRAIFMDMDTFQVQLFGMLCQNVEGILQPDQPKWLITDREI